ncbi:MAG: hypothetical protein KI790_03475 [Cyclobacteriaceae bacterium]|nr:hypothetical protein [Cyclobacteriaceae bacterium HetDA_MAG_MS6]
MKSLKIYHLLVALLVGTFISCAEEDGEGDPQETGLSGLYVGTAFQGSTQVGTWVATVYENRLIGVSTGEAGEVIFEGTVTNSGAVSGSFDLADIDGIVYTTNISGQIENGTMSGVWSDDEDSGTWTGERL